MSPLQNRGNSNRQYVSAPFDLKQVYQAISEKTAGSEFTGLLAAGPQIRANANSLGQQHWFANESFFLDYSLFTVNQDHENKAVKATYAANAWSGKEFEKRFTASQDLLKLLKRPSRAVNPGAYRTYLAPAAVAELVDMLSWRALSYSAFKKGSCPLAKMAGDHPVLLSAKFSLRENFELGVATPFNELGEVPEPHVSLISEGKLQQFLISSASASEFKAAGNFAAPSENLRSPEVLAGTLPNEKVLQELGTGLYLGNLHYCNWSDQQTARVTGMTRYACFWVEDGEIVAPLRDLRFDESLYNCFGANLEAVTTEQHLEIATGTYDHRTLGGKLLPGMLIQDFQFTL